MHKALRLLGVLTAAVPLFGLTLQNSAARAESEADASALIRQGEAELERGEIEAAILSLTRAVNADQGSSLAHTRLGGALLLGRQYARAIEQFQQAISIDAQNAAAFIGMGVAFLHSGQSGSAKAALLEAKRLDPDRAADIDVLIQRINAGASLDAR